MLSYEMMDEVFEEVRSECGGQWYDVYSDVDAMEDFDRRLAARAGMSLEALRADAEYAEWSSEMDEAL